MNTATPSTPARPLITISRITHLVLDGAGLPEGKCETRWGADATAAEWTAFDGLPRTVVAVDSPEGQAALKLEAEQG